MRNKTYALATKEDLLIDLTFHKISACLVAEFKQKIVDPHYNGNLNAAIQDLINKTLQEQNFALSHITHIRN